MPFVFASPPIKSIALPIVATGNQGFSTEKMSIVLIEAACNWLSLGMPVENIKIIEINQEKIRIIKEQFMILKGKYQNNAISPSKPKYDLFLSYSHENFKDVDFVEQELRKIKPDINLFIDRNEIDTGAAWQEKIYQSLDESNKIIAFLSMPYLKSKVCKEEFNIGLFRHRESENSILLPVYLYSAELPTYMKLINYIDCREANVEKLKKACEILIMSLK